MRVNVAQSPPPSPSSSLSPHSSQNGLPSSVRIHRSTATLTLPRPKSTAHNHPLRRSCSASFDGHDFPHHHHYPIDHFNPKAKSTTPRTITSFLRHVDSHVEVLEPSLLGIRPEPPDWPARDAVIRDCIARRASSIDFPLSLKMIKMKQKFLRLEEERDIEINDLGSLENNPMNNLCCSTLYIIREVQSHALRSRGLMLDEELDDGVVSKVQREMTSSFVWLFKEVFAKTPDLMLQVMVVTSTFATHSLESLQLSEGEKKDSSGNWGAAQLELGKSGVPNGNISKGVDESEVGLWNSMVVEADQIRGRQVLDQGLEFVVDRDRDDHDHDRGKEHNHVGGLLAKKSIEFVSPVKIEIEEDDYEEYHKTDLLYQIGLFQEPNNTLLLSNYAQFLCRVSRDYDRAEEYFKRAIQLDPTDAEAMSLYANFLWVVRKDLWGAEERFQQAMATEPDNSHHASKYASFLWSTGGDDTCYAVDPPRGKS